MGLAGILAAILLFPLFVVPTLKAQFVFDWNDAGVDWDDVANPWTLVGPSPVIGSTYEASQTFLNVDGSGADVTITVRLVGADGIGGLILDDSTAFTGIDGNTTNQSLALNPDWASNNPTESFLEVTIAFSQPVGAVAFDLFDVDRSTSDAWHDRITELDILVGDTAAIEVTPKDEANFHDQGGAILAADVPLDGADPNFFIEGNPTGTGIDYKRTGTAGTGVDPVSGGNITANYVADTDGLSSVTFQYAPGSESASNPQSQGIGLGNITFTPVPEAGTLLLPAALIGAWLLHRRLRRSRLQQPSSQA